MKYKVFTPLIIYLLLTQSALYAQTSTNKPVPPTPTKTPVQKSIQQDPKNQLSLTYAAKRLEYGVTLYENGDLQKAEKEVKETCDWLTDATNYHFDLYKTFSKDAATIKVGKVEKAYAHDFAELRDRAYYELAVIYTKLEKPKEATYYLVEIVKSQPDTAFGKTAYSALQKIQFAD